MKKKQETLLGIPIKPDKRKEKGICFTPYLEQEMKDRQKKTTRLKPWNFRVEIDWPTGINQLKRQVEREGGLFFITDGETKVAAGLSALPFNLSDNKGKNKNSGKKYFEYWENKPNARTGNSSYFLPKTGWRQPFPLFRSTCNIKIQTKIRQVKKR